MDHVDISQAFCQGDLLSGDGHNGKVYISAPTGYPEDPDICYLLRKPLYGMPSTARVAAHIDDFIIYCAHRPTLDKFKNALLARFDGTSEGAIRTYLGFEIKRNLCDGTTVLSQKHYAEDILRTFGFWDAHPLSTILVPHSRLSKDDCDPSPDRAFHLRYRGIVGSLGYLVNMTHPNLAFAYSELSKYVQSPGLTHMHAAEHALRYLRGTFDKSLKLSRDTLLVDTIWDWADSDWACDTDTRRSHAVYVLMLNGGPISWKSRRQDSVALSTSEAEYMAASEVGKEIQYLRSLLHDVGFTQLSPTNVYEDNLACIAMSTNPVRRKSSRHIDMRIHYRRELYTAGIMKLIPLLTISWLLMPLPKAFLALLFRSTAPL
jgi:hypothetical protein